LPMPLACWLELPTPSASGLEFANAESVRYMRNGSRTLSALMVFFVFLYPGLWQPWAGICQRRWRSVVTV
jgi:hypothetical protein